MRAPKIGSVIDDGSMYVGISRKTGNMLFVTLPDTRDLMNLKDSEAYLSELNLYRALGHDDWRLPDVSELEVIFENIQKGPLSGIFNEAGKLPATQADIIPLNGRASPGWYRAVSASDVNVTPCISFKDGRKFGHLKIEPVSVLYIREGGKPDAYTSLKNSAKNATRVLQAKAKTLSR